MLSERKTEEGQGSTQHEHTHSSNFQEGAGDIDDEPAIIADSSCDQKAPAARGVVDENLESDNFLQKKVLSEQPRSTTTTSSVQPSSSNSADEQANLSDTALIDQVWKKYRVKVKGGIHCPTWA